MFVWLRMPWEFVRLMTRKSSAAQRNYTNRLTVSYSRLLETQINQERDRINMRRLTAGLVIFALVVKSPVRGPTRLVLQSRLFFPPIPFRAASGCSMRPPLEGGPHGSHS